MANEVWYCPVHGPVDVALEPGDRLCPHCLDGGPGNEPDEFNEAVENGYGPPSFQTLSLGAAPIPHYEPTWDESDDAMTAFGREKKRWQQNLQRRRQPIPRTE